MQSLFDRLLPPSWLQIGLVAAILAVLALAVVTFDGLWPDMWREGYWSILFTAPTVIVYILIISRVMVPFQNSAVNSLHRISSLEDEEYNQLVQKTQMSVRKWAGLALALGFAFGFLATSPWANEDGFSWTMWYLALVNGLMFGFLAMVLQQSLAESRLTNHLQQGPLDFDIFYTSPFIPIGLHSLVVALAFIGGSTIVVFFSAVGRRPLNPVDGVLHGILILLTLLIFFLPMRQTHSVLRQAKLAEQDSLRRHMADAYRRLEQMTLAEKQDILPFATEVSLWTQYEERLKEVSTWPYNAGMLRTLFVSILLPVLVTLGQRLLAYLLIELGIN
jgi:uncharacterized membrane protein